MTTPKQEPPAPADGTRRKKARTIPLRRPPVQSHDSDGSWAHRRFGRYHVAFGGRWGRVQSRGNGASGSTDPHRHSRCLRTVLRGPTFRALRRAPRRCLPAGALNSDPQRKPPRLSIPGHLVSRTNVVKHSLNREDRPVYSQSKEAPSAFVSRILRFSSRLPSAWWWESSFCGVSYRVETNQCRCRLSGRTTPN
jgi:hypothetical protein